MGGRAGVLFAAGRFAVPLPIGETMIAAWLLAEAGLDVPLGPLTVAPVHLGDRLALARDGDGWTLSGTVTRVPWGGAAGHVVVAVEGEGGPVVALAKQGHARLEADVNLALEPRDTLVFDRAPVVAAGPARAAASPWLLGALIRSAQMAGGLEALLAKSVKYVTERRQFGRPLIAVPGRPAEPGLARRAHRRRGHGRPEGLSRHAARRRRLRDRGRQDPHRRGGRNRGGDRPSGPRRHRLHLRAHAALQHAAAVVVARGVWRRTLLAGAPRPRSRRPGPRPALAVLASRLGGGTSPARPRPGGDGEGEGRAHWIDR